VIRPITNPHSIPIATWRTRARFTTCCSDGSPPTGAISALVFDPAAEGEIRVGVGLVIAYEIVASQD
jgi:hypothetical protein